MSYKCIFNIFEILMVCLFLFLTGVTTWSVKADSERGSLAKPHGMCQLPMSCLQFQNALTRNRTWASSVEGKDFATELSIWASNGLLLNSEICMIFASELILKFPCCFQIFLLFFPRKHFTNSKNLIECSVSIKSHTKILIHKYLLKNKVFLSSFSTTIFVHYIFNDLNHFQFCFS